MRHNSDEFLNKFKEDVKNFKANTSYVSYFDLRECQLYHIESNENEDFIKISDCNNTINALNENKHNDVFKLSGIKKGNIDADILTKIENHDITSLIVYNKRVLYLDDGARSTIAQKCKTSGATLYKKDYVSDIILQANMLAYTPTKGIKYPIGVIRKEGKSLSLKAVLSKMPNDFSCEYEMDNEDLTLYDYTISKSGISVSFDGEEINGYIPSIIINWSDTGRGNDTILAVRPIGSKTPVPVESIDRDYNLNDCWETISKYIANKSDNKCIDNPTDIFNSTKGFDAIGKARIKKYIIPESLKGLSEREFCKKVLSFPDTIGKINTTTDVAFLNALGSIFKAM